MYTKHAKLRGMVKHCNAMRVYVQMPHTLVSVVAFGKSGQQAAVLCYHRACECGGAYLYCCSEPELPWQPTGSARAG